MLMLQHHEKLTSLCWLYYIFQSRPTLSPGSQDLKAALDYLDHKGPPEPLEHLEKVALDTLDQRVPLDHQEHPATLQLASPVTQDPLGSLAPMVFLGQKDMLVLQDLQGQWDQVVEWDLLVHLACQECQVKKVKEVWAFQAHQVAQVEWDQWVPLVHLESLESGHQVQQDILVILESQVAQVEMVFQELLVNQV
ncbi:hypothetical protein AALO_G00107180 [Alosa alosa]|uniref:Uncharacterized protein n=1 Tax=Alosa alosa TaxID=278164 RepID=A0AAV6GSE9_9TELE|nr:hypothetical protein AALO_G00107180 [Alosa alosa]